VDATITYLTGAPAEIYGLALNAYDNAVDAYASSGAAATSASAASTSAANALASKDAAVLAAAGALITSGGTATSTTANTLGYGAFTITVQNGKSYVPGMPVVVASTASPSNWLSGNVTSYNSGTGVLVVNATRVNGAASVSDWTVSPSAPGVTADLGYLHVRDEKASGTGGGASVVGVQTRTLNTVVENTIAGASLASNRVSLPPGKYRFQGSAPSVYRHRALLVNHTDSTTIQAGTNGYGSAQPTTSFVSGKFTLSATKEIRLDQYIGTADSSGLSGAITSGTSEIYSVLEIWKEA
jgi:hypothetical protein